MRAFARHKNGGKRGFPIGKFGFPNVGAALVQGLSFFGGRASQGGLWGKGGFKDRIFGKKRGQIYSDLLRFTQILPGGYGCPGAGVTGTRRNLATRAFGVSSEATDQT